jgi:hypothetical protein
MRSRRSSVSTVKVTVRQSALALLLATVFGLGEVPLAIGATRDRNVREGIRMGPVAETRGETGAVGSPFECNTYQRCHTECQSTLTDCSLGCDGVEACVKDCEAAARSCATGCLPDAKNPPPKVDPQPSVSIP